MENNFKGLKKFILERVKNLHNVTVLTEEKKRIEKTLKLLSEEDIGKNLLRHYKITYDQPVESNNRKELEKEVIWLDKRTNIKGKNTDKEIRELNIGDNQEVIPAKY